MDHVTGSLDSGNPADAIFLDFAKASDKVPHHRLALKLKVHRVTGKRLQWTVVWLKDRKQRICINGTKSIWQIVLSGVPQGSISGPILFLIYINDLDQGIWNWILKVAGDIKIFGEVSTTSQHQKLQQDIVLLVPRAANAVQHPKMQGNAF